MCTRHSLNQESTVQDIKTEQNKGRGEQEQDIPPEEQLIFEAGEGTGQCRSSGAPGGSGGGRG
jgi:hypothetical protein